MTAAGWKAIDPAATAAESPRLRVSTTFYGGLDAANLSLAWSALWETRETRLSAQTETWRKATTGKAGSVRPTPGPRWNTESQRWYRGNHNR